MSETFALEPAATTSKVDGLVVLPGAVEASQAVRERRIPLTIPSAQEYYWHFEWQSGERETLEGLAAGDYVDFDSDDPEDAVRWLRESAEGEDE